MEEGGRDGREKTDCRRLISPISLSMSLSLHQLHSEAAADCTTVCTFSHFAAHISPASRAADRTCSHTPSHSAFARASSLLSLSLSRTSAAAAFTSYPTHCTHSPSAPPSPSENAAKSAHHEVSRARRQKQTKTLCPPSPLPSLAPPLSPLAQPPASSPLTFQSATAARSNGAVAERNGRNGDKTASSPLCFVTRCPSSFNLPLPHTPATPATPAPLPPVLLQRPRLPPTWPFRCAAKRSALCAVLFALPPFQLTLFLSPSLLLPVASAPCPCVCVASPLAASLPPPPLQLQKRLDPHKELVLLAQDIVCFRRPALCVLCSSLSSPSLAGGGPPCHVARTRAARFPSLGL